MATAGIVAGDPGHVLVGVVPDDPDPDPKLSVWLGRDAMTEIRLVVAEELAKILTDAVKVAKGEAELATVVDERKWVQ
jgi:hypothetical protein